MSEIHYHFVQASGDNAQEIVDFLNRTGFETDNMSFGGNQYRKTAEELREEIEKANRDESEIRYLVRNKKTKELLALGSTYNLGKRSKHVYGVGLVVQKKNWRQGIGKALMIKLIDEAKRLGAEKITLDLNAVNIAALSLYQSLGFLVDGRLIKQLKFPDGSYQDLILMSKMID